MQLTIKLRVARHPRRNGEAFSVYRVMLEERMTVLDALFRAQREQDSTLAFRCACRVGMCGTRAVNLNWIPRLACSTRVKSTKSEVAAIDSHRHSVPRNVQQPAAERIQRLKLG